MTGDPTFWKDRYNDGQWKGGVRRVKKVIAALQEKGLDATPYADDALSEEYIKATSHERGEPDVKIAFKDRIVLLEVTGPDINIPATSGLWFRPDKLEYAENHPELEVWGAHIIEGPPALIRFIQFTPGMNKKYPTVRPTIRGTTETFKEIPANDTNILTLQQFCDQVHR